MYTWKIADNSEYNAIIGLLQSENWSEQDIYRRVIVPLSLQHLILFYKNDKPFGFITLAFMDKEAASHQDTLGILPSDWKSGNDFWVVDLVAPFGECPRLLRMLISNLNHDLIKKINYFRAKYKQIRRVLP